MSVPSTGPQSPVNLEELARLLASGNVQLQVYVAPAARDAIRAANTGIHSTNLTDRLTPTSAGIAKVTAQLYNTYPRLKGMDASVGERVDQAPRSSPTVKG